MSGVAVSGFSLSSLLFTPVVVRISNRAGRYKVLRACLLGCALAQLLIVQATTPGGVVVGRLVSGVFAASVPVAQAAVTDLVSPAQSALALSRVSAVSQLGVVVGPAFGALAIAVLNRLGVADIAGMHMRCVFAVSSAFAMAVLLLQFAFGDAANAAKPAEPPAEAEAEAAGSEAVSPSGRRLSDALPLSSKATEVAEALPLVPLVRKRPYDQWALRLVAISIGWGLTLCMATYCLFGSAIVGYAQQQLSINFSVAAAVSVVAQLVLFPRLVHKLGEHLVCALGLTVSSIGLIGVSLFKLNPLHAAIYLVTRTGNALGDTACATLVARASDGSEARARNLGAIYSVRAGARIVTPLLSAWLFEISRRGASGGGALPYFIVSALTAALIPVPLVLKSFEDRKRE